LRGEVGVLRNQTKELEKLKEESRQLRASLVDRNQSRQEPEADPTAEEQKALAVLKLNHAKQFVLGMIMFADDHSGRFPRNFGEVSPYFGDSGNSDLNNLNQIEIVYQGSVKNIESPATIIVVREKEASLLYGKWFKAYGFADGHSELKPQPEGGFDAWEKQHTISSPLSAQ
jgi:hypothetical protein